MALNYKILDTKGKLRKNNVTYIDLLSKSLNDEVYMNASIIMVNKNYVARPDLIALAVYGDDKYADILCKINGISNPFEMNEDDVIVLPSIEYIRDAVKYYNDVSDLIEDPKNDQIIIKDPENNQKKKTDSRMPNEQIEGEQNYIIDKSLGVVFY